MRYLIGLIVLLIPMSGFASYKNIDKDIKQVYNIFYNQLDKKNSKKSSIVFLKKLDNAIDNLKKNKKLSESNYSKISDLEKLNNEKIFRLEFNQEEELTKNLVNSNELFKNFKHKAFNDDILVLENGIWYSYDFEKMYYFKNTKKINYNDLIKNGINPQTDLLIKGDKDIAFVNNFNKYKVVSNDIIYGIPNKLETLNFLKKSNRYLKNDIDNDLIKIKNESIDLTKGETSREQIIKTIYAYILDNIEYSRNFNLNDYEIYSGVETFKNKDGVCEGYVELFSLMLSFNGVKSNIIKGDVIDAVDFPNVGHAWTKIGNYYYDITFDDPIGSKNTKTYNEYEYFKLPEDLFYTNRYDFGDTPEKLKNTDKKYRKELIRNNLFKLVKKYRYSNYNLLKPIIFREENNLDIQKDISVDDIINIYDFYTFKDYKIYFKNETKTVKSLSYTLIEDFSLKSLLKENNYDLSGKTLLKWETKDYNNQYIMVNEITYK